jgi:hypothetical protein
MFDSLELMFQSLEHRFIYNWPGKTHQTFYLLTYRYYCCILLNINYLYLLIPKIFCIFVKNN